MAPHKPKPIRFFFFTCRDPRTDFRLPLVQALRRDFDTWYIVLKRSPIVAGPGTSGQPMQMSLRQLFVFLWNQRKERAIPVYFNSTNTLYPYFMLFLRLISPSGVWCLDMHDDLLYDSRGLARLRKMLAIRVMRLFSDITVHAAPTLQELFPTSKHMGNASHLMPLERLGGSDGKVLILSSVDGRFDFDLVSRAARRCAALTFDIYGQISADVRTQFDRLMAGHRNIRYHGSYEMDDLPDILSRYAVAFAPYMQNVRRTRYIDPLRFYHCLNSGMEVITTDIPQAQQFKHAVHIVRGAEELPALFTDSGGLTLHKQTAYTPVTWQQRAERLVEIVQRLPRTERLVKSSGWR